MPELVLRNYQEQAIFEIKNCMLKHKKVLLMLAGGAGKTVIFCQILKQAIMKGNPALIVVRGVKLIEQASERLTREGVPHGVYQGMNSHSESSGVLVCSIDTLYARKIAPPARLVVIDEAHLSQGAAYEWFLAQYPDAYILAVTATPYLKKGLRHVADAVVQPIAIRELIQQSYLVPPRYFAPETPDLTKVRITGGDFNAGELEAVMQERAVYGDVVKSWLRFGENRPSLMFAVSVKHSRRLCERFNEHGVASKHIDATTSQVERNAVIQQLVSGNIKIVSSVGVLTTGFDCPPVGCLVVCRPTMSRNLHIQMLYRGTRPYPGKTDFIVLDHAGNLSRHGFIEDELPAELDGYSKKKLEKCSVPQVKNCQECLAVHYLTDEKCPGCGAVNHQAAVERDRRLKEIEAEMVEIETQKHWVQIGEWLKIAKSKNLKKGWLYHMIKGKYGDQFADKYWNRIKVMKRDGFRQAAD